MATNMQRAGIVVIGLIFLASTAIIVAYPIILSNQSNKESEQIEESLNQNKENQLQGTQLQNFTPLQTVNELKIEDLTEGSGSAVKSSDKVNVHYTGALASNGIIFQSSYDFGEPVSFQLDQVIPGWTQGMIGMKEGGKRRLIIPAELAYGSSPPPSSGIPPNSALVFDVELLKIEQ